MNKKLTWGLAAVLATGAALGVGLKVKKMISGEGPVVEMVMSQEESQQTNTLMEKINEVPPTPQTTQPTYEEPLEIATQENGTSNPPEEIEPAPDYTISQEYFREVVIEKGLDHFVDSVIKEVDTMKKLEIRHGREGVFEEYYNASNACFNLAFNDEDGIIQDREYELLAKKIVGDANKFSKPESRVNYLDSDGNPLPEILESHLAWTRALTEFYLPITEAIKANPLQSHVQTQEEVVEYVRKVVQEAYPTREAYSAKIGLVVQASNEVHEAMRLTLTGGQRLFGGNNQIEGLRKRSEEGLRFAEDFLYEDKQGGGGE